MPIAGSLRDKSFVADRTKVPSDSSGARTLLLAEIVVLPALQVWPAPNPSLSIRVPDNRFIAGELAIECRARSSEPDKRMEP